MRILVIEDEPRILGFLARGLEAEGFSVDGAGDGAAGVEQAARRRYDLVILDLLLPKLDGLSVLRALQRERPELPVVIVSARTDSIRSSAGSGSAPATTSRSRSRSTSCSRGCGRSCDVGGRARAGRSCAPGHCRSTSRAARPV